MCSHYQPRRTGLEGHSLCRWSPALCGSISHKSQCLGPARQYWNLEISPNEPRLKFTGQSCHLKLHHTLDKSSDKWKHNIQDSFRTQMTCSKETQLVFLDAWTVAFFTTIFKTIFTFTSGSCGSFLGKRSVEGPIPLRIIIRTVWSTTVVKAAQIGTSISSPGSS